MLFSNTAARRLLGDVGFAHSSHLGPSVRSLIR